MKAIFYLSIFIVCTISHVSTPLFSSSPVALEKMLLENISITKINHSPSIDGRFDDEIWNKLESHHQFIQNKPFHNKQASEKTWFKIAYDEENLYLAIYLENKRTPIVYASSVRDASLELGDSIAVILDPLKKQQQGYVFGTNPNGALYDATLNQDNPNSNWNTEWEVKTRVNEKSWQAEFKIPFQNLLFDPTKQRWSFNIVRNIAHNLETVSLTSVSQNRRVISLNKVIDITGFRIKTKRSLKATPYLLNSYNTEKKELELKAGGELTYKKGAQKTIKLSFNTDFAQTEVDEQQVELSQFSIFFPEKRQFFLENQNFFKLNTGSWNRQFEMFFSRRIGLNEDKIVPILGGINYFENRGAHQFGIINMITDKLDEEAQTNYNVVRYKHILGQRRHIGLMMTNKDSLDRSKKSQNRVIGFDSQYKFNENFEVNSFLVQSFDKGTQNNNASTFLRGTYRSPNSYTWLSHYYVGEQFNPEMGYLRENDIHNIRFGHSKNWYNLSKQFRKANLRGSATLKYDHKFTFKQQKYDVRAELNSYKNLNIEWNIETEKEKLSEDIDIYDVNIKKNTYATIRHTLEARKVKIGSYAYGFFTSIGDYYDGHLNDIGINASIKPYRELTTRLSLRYLDASLNAGGFNFYLASISADYQLSQKKSTQRGCFY